MIILSLFIFLVLVLHSSARIYRHYVFKQPKGNYITELNLLKNSDFYTDYLITIAERLGEGSSRNSGSKFSKAHENQSFVVNSILDLISELEE